MAYRGKVAHVYDALYREKPYSDEVQWAITRLGLEPCGLRVLEVACGTGRHAAALAEAGAIVTGIDVSEDLLSEALVRMEGLGERFQAKRGEVRLFHGDMRAINDLGLPRDFDVCLSFFDSLGYAITNEAILSTVRGMRGHVRPGGKVAAEVWAAPAMVQGFDPLRTIMFTDGNGIGYERKSRTTLDLASQTATVKYEFTNLTTKEEFYETHRNRFFMPQEIALFFSEAGLCDIEVCPAYKPIEPVDTSHFHLFCSGIR